MKHLKIYNKEYILSVTKVRRFETKLGECLQIIENAEDIEGSIRRSNAKFVLVGVPEDIGIKANLGIGGADSAWLSFLKAFFSFFRTKSSNRFGTGGSKKSDPNCGLS